MGINTTSNINQQAVIRALAGGTITSGDLVTNSEQGKVLKSYAALGIANENITTAGCSAIKAPAPMETNANYTIDIKMNDFVCELENGNIVFLYSGNGSSASSNLQFRIRNILGADVISKVTVTSDTSIGGYSIHKLNSTKFVVVWNTSSTIKFAIYNNDGTVAVAATTVDSMSSTAYNYWAIDVTPNGNFIIAYAELTTLNATFRRYDPSGVLQGSETIVESNCNPYHFEVLGCSNNDFIIYYYRSTATAGMKFARYNSSGVIIGSLTTVGSSSANAIPYGDKSIFELSNGNLVFVFGEGSSYPDLQIYNSSNATVGSLIDLGVSVVTSLRPAIVPLDSGDFAVITQYSTTSHLSTYDATGKNVLPVRSLTASGLNGGTTSTTGTAIKAFNLGASGFVIYRISYANSDGSYDAAIFTCTPLGGSVGNAVILRGDNGNPILASSAILHSSGNIVGTFKEPGALYIADFYYNTARKSILGVALESKTVGQTIRIATEGTYTINQQFSAGGVFDSTTATVPGCKGSVIGTTATLRGTK
jgi:hypothetical protein